MDALDAPVKAKMQLSVAVDEIMANISNYAYEDGVGPVTVRLGFEEETGTVSLTFVDKGLPYNPLEKEDPDVTLSAEDRPIGGLGIYLVKKTMDYIAYEYKFNQNILTMQKKLR